MMTERTAFDPNQPIHIAPNAHYGCRLCAGGCRSFDVLLTEIEARRLGSAWWRPLLHDVPEDEPLVLLDQASHQYTLNRVDDRCVFLDSDNLCIVHKAAGADAKPLACQIFPIHAVQTPHGLNVSLNVSCRRLVEMTAADPLLDADEAQSLLSRTQAVTTLGETVPITPDLTLTYDEYLTFNTRLIACFNPPARDWQAAFDQLAAMAELLLTLPGVEGADDERALWTALDQQINQPRAWRSTLGALYRRSADWVMAAHDSNPRLAAAMAQVEQSAAPAHFWGQIANQWLIGDQAALHRTMRTGWTGLLAAFIGALYATPLRIDNGQPADQALNEAVADAIDLFFSPAGQLALTEPSQQALLRSLSQHQ